MKEALIDGRRFGRNLLVLFLFSLPVLYLGSIAAVFIHEVIGHGCAARVLGGRFTGFGIALDGMGWANIEVKSLPAPRLAAMLASGAACTTVFSLALFTLGTAFGRKPAARFTFIILGFAFMLDGLPYYFWDAIYRAGIGDFSMIWNLYPNDLLRVIVIGLSGLLMAGMIVLFNIWYYRTALSHVSEGNPVNPIGKIALSLMVLLEQALCWFVFDWNQLVPGVGLLPSFAGIAVALAVLIVLVVSPGTVQWREPRESMGRFKGPMIAAWAACFGTMLCIALLLQDGVRLPF
jgi:hypothetical protein